jgi:hypothetical protein
LLVDIADPDVLLAALGNPPPEMTQAMRYGGVLPETMAILAAT